MNLKNTRTVHYAYTHDLHQPLLCGAFVNFGICVTEDIENVTCGKCLAMIKKLQIVQKPKFYKLYMKQ